ncbi:family 10 glycosylhydrolase [Phormidium pseudopriestleyi FRX01]|uniref:Family 10 glycosylhydrolase n=1 Tax=Phormidium pseudopriestleyi FRX01 TaxID=1759528 RepID=A0ABS3FP66_9CYAN|nr:family 10 glycosylhydrolase [Phormidium pseudopriestleyi]MBO0348401.1 family 10 glycosylhydrolase [Phormidium pseudopriestleyi FRX01]
MSDRRYHLGKSLRKVQLRLDPIIYTHRGQWVIGTLVASLGLLSTPVPGAIAQQIPAEARIPETSLSQMAPGRVPSQSLTENSALRLGVVRSPENEAQWEAIDARLRAAGLVYETIELDRLLDDAIAANITVLFIPNISTWTVEQALALESLLSQGVHAVVSGPLGVNSAAGIRHALTATIGGTWQGQLSQPTPMEPLYCRTELLCPSNWIPPEVNRIAIPGGILAPSGYNTEVMTTWGPAPGNPAVLIGDRMTFFGWEWGNHPDVEYDSAWLRAALLRNEVQRGPRVNRTVAGQENTPPPPPSQAPSSPAPNEAEQLREAEVQRRQPSEEPPQPITPVPPPAPVPQAPARPSPSDTLPSFPESSTPSDRSTVQAEAVSPPGLDPAEETAPPGLIVEQGPLPILSFQAIEMRQELENLLGRVESALITASVHAQGPQQARSQSEEEMREKLPIASASLVVVGEKTGAEIGEAIAQIEQAFLPTSEAIATARSLLLEFPQLVQQQDYAGARAKWVEIRDLLWENYPTNGVLAQPEIRAIWLDRGSIVRAGSEQGLARIFDNLAATGINTVFFETVNAGYPIYPSQVAPQQNPLIGNWDPLAVAVKLAHDRNMELHAWIWTFAAGNQRHNVLLNLDPNYPGPVIAAHPDWASYTNDGQMIPRGQTKPFLDPANPEVRRYLLNILEEIATRYDVDGVQLDYIRYPFQDPSAERSYGYGKVARQEFQNLTGVDPMTITPGDRDLWQQWTDFRVRQVDSFVSEASQRLRTLRSDLILSVAVFPLNPHDRRNKIQQNWEEWARRGEVDLIVPMTYAMDTNRLEQLAQPWINQEDLGAALILPAIRLLDLPEIIAVDQIQALRNQSVGGYALFAAENLNPVLNGIFQRTQGPSALGDRTPIPYREPFAAAAARFAGLQREWQFLQDTEELSMREVDLTGFEDKGLQLTQALEELASDPSGPNLQQAHSVLREFRGQFRGWMNLYSLQKPYQIQTWENRLQTLEDLLSYGEQFLLKR